jgi:CheY-like chemotaxis protein
LKADLPEPGSKADQNIYCDKTRVREIIINLLSNAGRFTEQGGVSVRAHFESNHLIVMVEDTGPGISDENQTRLFEPFQQLDSSIRRRYGGSGLGLAICKRFVEMHGGKMWLESEVGEGTTFLFSLPVSSMEMDNYGTNATRWVNDYTVRDVRTRSFKVSLGIPKPRCIVLEDGETIHHLLNRYLDHIEILPVQTVGEVIEKVAQFPSQLVIINHPDSVSLLNSITSQGHLPVGLPVLAFWMPGAEDFSDTIGANRYFVKPVSKDILLEAVTSFGDQVKRILIVDDNPEIIQLFGRILASADRHYQVLRASDGPQALELMRSRQPDLMILDLIMPEINGFQVLEEKRGDPAICDIPVIVITAQDPAGLPKVSYSVTIAREGGFSSRDILDLVESVGLKSDVVQPNAGTG